MEQQYLFSKLHCRKRTVIPKFASYRQLPSWQAGYSVFGLVLNLSDLSFFFFFYSVTSPYILSSSPSTLNSRWIFISKLNVKDFSPSDVIHWLTYLSLKYAHMTYNFVLKNTGKTVMQLLAPWKLAFKADLNPQI